MYNSAWGHENYKVFITWLFSNKVGKFLEHEILAHISQVIFHLTLNIDIKVFVCRLNFVSDS